MEDWLLITIMIIGLITFLALVIWLDWIFKCRKSVRDNSLRIFLPGFIALRCDDGENALLLLDGIFGINESQLIFAHRFKDDALYIVKDISSICEFVLTNYNEKELLDSVNGHSAAENNSINCYLRRMTGYAKTKGIFKGLKTRLVCRIRFNDDEELYFFYKNKNKSIERIHRIQIDIQAITVAI